MTYDQAALFITLIQALNALNPYCHLIAAVGQYNSPFHPLQTGKMAHHDVNLATGRVEAQRVQSDEALLHVIAS